MREDGLSNFENAVTRGYRYSISGNTALEVIEHFEKFIQQVPLDNSGDNLAEASLPEPERLPQLFEKITQYHLAIQRLAKTLYYSGILTEFGNVSHTSKFPPAPVEMFFADGAYQISQGLSSWHDYKDISGLEYIFDSKEMEMLEAWNRNISGYDAAKITFNTLSYKTNDNLLKCLWNKTVLLNTGDEVLNQRLDTIREEMKCDNRNGGPHSLDEVAGWLSKTDSPYNWLLFLFHGEFKAMDMLRGILIYVSKCQKGILLDYSGEYMTEWLEADSIDGAKDKAISFICDDFEQKCLLVQTPTEEPKQ